MTKWIKFFIIFILLAVTSFFYLHNKQFLRVCNEREKSISYTISAKYGSSSHIISSDSSFLPNNCNWAIFAVNGIATFHIVVDNLVVEEGYLTKSFAFSRHEIVFGEDEIFLDRIEIKKPLNPHVGTSSND